MTQKMYYTVMNSKIGPLTLVGTVEHGLCALKFGDFINVEATLKCWIRKYMGHVEMKRNKEVLSSYEIAIADYLNGNGRKNLLHLEINIYGTPFQKKVWNELLQIEYGSTKSYKEIAEAIGFPKAVRAVGTAIGRNPLPIIIPCHRVINANGKLGGFAGGIETKKKLLHIEGVRTF